MLMKYLFIKKQDVFTARDYRGTLGIYKDYQITHVFEAELPYPLQPQQVIHLAPRNNFKFEPEKSRMQRSANGPFVIYELGNFLEKLDVSDSGQIVAATKKSKEDMATDYFLTNSDELSEILRHSDLEVKAELSIT